MKSKPLSTFTIYEIEEEIDLIDEEMVDMMHPISYDRYKKLFKYKQKLKEELKTKQGGIVADK